MTPLLFNLITFWPHYLLTPLLFDLITFLPHYLLTHYSLIPLCFDPRYSFTPLLFDPITLCHRLATKVTSHKTYSTWPWKCFFIQKRMFTIKCYWKLNWFYNAWYWENFNCTLYCFMLKVTLSSFPDFLFKAEWLSFILDRNWSLRKQHWKSSVEEFIGYLSFVKNDYNHFLVHT